MHDRDAHLDTVKTVAILCVIVIHVSSSGWSVFPTGSFEWVSNMFWASLTRAAVPLFMMCSGALLLNPKKEITLKKLYTKNLPRVIAAMIVWAVFYKIYHLVDENQFTASAFIQAMKHVMVFDQEFHLYFVHMIILVYVLLPVTRVITRSADKKQLEYSLAVWFIFGILYPTVRNFWPINLINGFPTQWIINMTYASIGYGLLGYYIKYCSTMRRRVYPVMLTTGFAIVFGGTWLISIIRGSFTDVFLGGMSVGVALMAAGLFGCLPGIRLRAISYISKASFCIYLVHVVFLYLSEKVGFTIALFPAVLSVPLLSVAIFACSCGVYAVLSQIPVVNKWLI